MKPNFFVIGAPKCGTTSLCEYLRAHPRIGMSIPKEPHYFCTDFSTRFRKIYTEQQYLRCFDHVRDGCAAAGEGSVWYLFSEAAVANILRFAPDAKFIVMVRNPLDMVYSWHAQALYSRDETVAEFEIAWRLQSKRAYGEGVPRSTREPRCLQYWKVASLGEQLGRLYEQVTRDRVKVIVFDDFTNDTAKAYSDVLGFLGVPPDGRTDFPRINENKAHRSTAVGHLLSRRPRALMRGVLGLKEAVGIRRLGIIAALTTINTRRGLRRPLDAKFRAELSSAFQKDVEELSSLLQRDLSHWLSGSDAVVAP